MGDLTGRVALVTGAAQGIGYGIAVALAKAGAAIAAVDLNADGAVRAAEDFRALGVNAIGIGCDVRDRAQVDAAVDQTVQELGGLTVLVNCAMAARSGVPLEEATDEDLRLALATGPEAAFYFMRAAFPHMTGRDGRIINVRSGSEIQGLVGFGTYIAAKAAMGGLTRAAAREWGKKGITVNGIMPFSLSPKALAYFDTHPEELTSALSSLSIPRTGNAETDIGAAVVFLAGPGGSFVTGCTITVDGGGSFLG